MMKKAAWVLLAMCWVSCSTGPKKLSDHDKAMLLINAASGSLSEGDPTGALQLLAQAESLDNEIAGLYHVRALAYFTKHDLKTAMTQIERSLKIAPNDSSALNTYGKILLDLGRTDEAHAPLLKAAKDSLNREAYKPYTSLGIIEYREGHFSEAGQYFDQAINEGGELACAAHYYKGHLYLRDAEYDDAVREYRAATHRACGNFVEAHLAVATAYERAHKYDLARKKYLDIETAFPDTPAAQTAISRMGTLP